MDQKQIIILFCAIVTIIAVGYGITQKPEMDTPEGSIITVVDCLNRTVMIEGPIEKIMLTGRGHALTLSAAYLFESAPEKIYGLADTIAESTLFSMVDPDIEAKILEGAIDIGVEEIASHEPDVVILKSYLKSKVGDPLESLGISVVYLDLEDLESYLRDIETLGKIMGEPERATEITQYYQSYYAEVEERNSAVLDAPSTMFLYYSTKGGTTAFKSPGAEWLQTTVISTAGGKPLSLELEGTGWNKVNLEQIAQWNPEIVFIVTYTDNPSGLEVKEMLEDDPLWQDIRAVKNEQIYAVPDDCFGTATVGSWDTGGSRWILGLGWMESKINGDPVRFADDIHEFYTRFYGLSESDTDTLIEAIVGDL